MGRNRITLEEWCISNNKMQFLKEWDYEENKQITPQTIGPGSHEKACWICAKCGKKWQTIIRSRTRGAANCPICSHEEKIERMRVGHLKGGKNSLSTVSPELAKEWDWSNNGSYTPDTVSAQSHMDAYWICEKGHHYKARIQNRMLGSKCPYCMRKIPVIGENDLETTNPEALIEWDYEKNSILPNQVFAGSEIKVCWIGKCGHRYKQMIANHVNGHGCPVCAGKIVVPGDNDLATRFPDILKEWDYEKNSILPTQITPFSTKKVWWICEKGHSFFMQVGSRTGEQKQGCPECAKELKTSFPEQAIFYYIKQVFSDAVNGDKSHEVELDIYIPSIKTAIEYDGAYWHKSKQSIKKDNRKDQLCKQKGIRLIRFRDPSLPDTISAERIICKDGNNRSLCSSLLMLFEMLQIKCPCINLEKDSARIISSYVINKKNSSLASEYPHIAREWHPTKNGSLTPDNISWGSGKKVWWKCSVCQTEWCCSPTVRTSTQAQGCPKCTKDMIKKEKSSAVRNVDTGEVFESITLAAKAYNGRVGDISTVCNGRQKTAFGFHWEYISGPQNRGHKYIGKVMNMDNHMIFDSLQEAAEWCDGKTMNISACCRGRQKTAYGYRWSFVEG